MSQTRLPVKWIWDRDLGAELLLGNSLGTNKWRGVKEAEVSAGSSWALMSQQRPQSTTQGTGMVLQSHSKLRQEYWAFIPYTECSSDTSCLQRGHHTLTTQLFWGQFWESAERHYLPTLPAAVAGVLQIWGRFGAQTTVTMTSSSWETVEWVQWIHGQWI